MRGRINQRADAGGPRPGARPTETTEPLTPLSMPLQGAKRSNQFLYGTLAGERSQPPTVFIHNSLDRPDGPTHHGGFLKSPHILIGQAARIVSSSTGIQWMVH